MVIVKSGGRTFQAEADSGEPSANLSAQRENLRAKFMALTSPVLGRRGAEALAHAALDADKLASTSELITLATRTA
jgi:hypothetical protein